MVPPLLTRTARATIAQGRSGPPGSTTLSESGNDVPRLSIATDRSATHISRTELLMLLEGLHGKLNACFEDLRRLPHPTARFEVRNRESRLSELANFKQAFSYPITHALTSARQGVFARIQISTQG